MSNPRQRISRSVQTSSFVLLAIALLLSTAASAQRLSGGKQRKSGDRSGRSSISTSSPDRPKTSERALPGDSLAKSSAGSASRDTGERTAASSERLSAQQKKNLQQLEQDLQHLVEGGKAAEDEIRALAQSLQQMSVQQPDPALTQALAEDLAEALADEQLSAREIARISESVHAVLDSAGVSQEELDQLVRQAQAALTASGLDRSDVRAVVDDLEAIVSEAQGNASSRSSGRRRLRDGGP